MWESSVLSLFAEVENTEQEDGMTMDRFNDMKVESSTIIINA
jgi:hypothetical protein